MTAVPERSPMRRWVALTIGVGAAFRLVHYGLNPSLSIDDLMLSYNIASRSWIGLIHPLDLQQTAPLVFLWALKLSALLGGLHEQALRVLPVLAGIALPYAVWRLAGRLMSPPAALVATAFAALSPILIEYSFSLKPYETDALIAAILGLLTLNVIDAPSRRTWTDLGAVGGLAILCSTPAVFVLAGCGLALFVGVGRKALAPVAVAGCLWVALFAVTYVTTGKAMATSPYMQAFWDHKFLTPAVIVGDPRRAWDIIQRLPTQLFTGDAPRLVPLILCWLAGIGGVISLTRQRGGRVWVVAGPVAVALLASMLRRYPVAPRLFVFAAPLVAVMLAAGVDLALARWSTGVPRAGLGALVGVWLLTLAILSVNVSRLWAPPTRLLFEQLKQERVDHEPLYVYAGAVPAWLFYGVNWADPADRALALSVGAAERWDGNAFQNAASRGHAVADTEGAHLTGRQHGSPLIIGLATGIAWREGQWLSQERPDSGWAGHEAGRIDEATDSTAWLVFSQLARREMPLLIHALAARHGRVLLEQGSRGAFLYHVRFSRPR